MPPAAERKLRTIGAAAALSRRSACVRRKRQAGGVLLMLLVSVVALFGVAALATEYDANRVLIEKAGLGLNLVQDLRDDRPTGMPCPIGIMPKGDKLTRLPSIAGGAMGSGSAATVAAIAQGESPCLN